MTSLSFFSYNTQMEKRKALMQLVCACMHTSRLAKSFTHVSALHVSLWRLKLNVSATKHAFWKESTECL